MNADELKERIESSAGLRRVKANLIDEVAFRADGLARLDPFTIITIISVVIQIISFCQKKNSDESIKQLMRSARTIPRRKTILLRRRLNNLVAESALGLKDAQPIYDAIMDMAENADDAEINEIITIARDCK